MRFMKNPYINAAVITAISTFYAAVFILTSGDMEFAGILSHSQTLNSAFWNGWTAFLQQGNQKYIGYVYLLAAACVLILSFIRKRNYDEYQVGILTTSLVITGILLLILFPIALLLVMSDSNYAVETLVFLVAVHWSVFLAVNLGLLLRWSRG
ncbi:MAG: hypothetical protein LUG61_07530 [Lachnospiraceae bacterium]|nr:hypothetical protein [Lachnospiraceae bacterium]